MSEEPRFESPMSFVERVSHLSVRVLGEKRVDLLPGSFVSHTTLLRRKRAW